MSVLSRLLLRLKRVFSRRNVGKDLPARPSSLVSVPSMVSLQDHGYSCESFLFSDDKTLNSSLAGGLGSGMIGNLAGMQSVLLIETESGCSSAFESEPGNPRRASLVSHCETEHKAARRKSTHIDQLATDYPLLDTRKTALKGERRKSTHKDQLATSHHLKLEKEYMDLAATDYVVLETRKCTPTDYLTIEKRKSTLKLERRKSTHIDSAGLEKVAKSAQIEHLSRRATQKSFNETETENLSRRSTLKSSHKNETQSTASPHDAVQFEKVTLVRKCTQKSFNFDEKVTLSRRSTQRSSTTLVSLIPARETNQHQQPGPHLRHKRSHSRSLKEPLVHLSPPTTIIKRSSSRASKHHQISDSEHSNVIRGRAKHRSCINLSDISYAKLCAQYSPQQQFNPSVSQSTKRNRKRVAGSMDMYYASESDEDMPLAALHRNYGWEE